MKADGDPVPAFVKLNARWNAEPNAPHPEVEIVGSTVVFRFTLNPWAFPEFPEGSVGSLTFSGCSRWRLGDTNDEGWYLGQCRYSGIAPEWGEFYELVGADIRRDLPTDWQVIAAADHASARHFLFYLRDETFECLALDWTFSWSPPSR